MEKVIDQKVMVRNNHGSGTLIVYTHSYPSIQRQYVSKPMAGLAQNPIILLPQVLKAYCYIETSRH
jgi:hypothetical protein